MKKNSNDTNSQLEELKQLQPATIIVKVGGEDVEVKPFKFKQLLAALTFISEMISDMDFTQDQSIVVLNIIGKHPEQVIGLLKLTTGKNDKFFDDLSMEEGLDLAIATFNVNKDFFAQKLAPKLEELRMDDQSSISVSEKQSDSENPTVED